MFPVYDLLVLTQIPGVGVNRLRALITQFGDPTAVASATAKEISQTEGFSKKLASEVTAFFNGVKLDEAKLYAEKQLSKANKSESTILTYWDKQFPDLLKRIDDPPVLLYMKGNLEELDAYSLAIVGTRNPSTYGTMMAEKFSEELSKIGITIVSGLARGIDTTAHSTAIKKGGRTLAIIGSGIDVIYPPENKKLADQITQQGALISEFAMGAKPDAVNFPRRNRIISGLTLGTIVIETDLSGGAMITSAMALNQNREVFAVPGNIDSKRSKGCNVLIKNGQAKLIESVDDILTELSVKLRPVLKNSEKIPAKPAVELNLFEQTIYNVFGDEPIHIDSITEKAKSTTADALVQLLSLEFKGLVKQLPGKMFLKI